MDNQFNRENATNCGSPNKYQSNGNQTVENNSYGSESQNAQDNIGFNNENEMNANNQKNGTKRYTCNNCGTVHYGSEPPKNCCKCDSQSFMER